MSKRTGKTLPRTLGGRTANLQICIVANQHKRLLVDLGVLFSRSGKTMEERKGGELLHAEFYTGLW